MLTSGHFIGEIIDDLSTIAYQVDTRCKMGLTDLNRLLEDFFKDVLNRLLDLHLTNLNRERMNVPGLDLGDGSGGYAFQVTSQNDATKVNKTLAVLSVDQLKTYPKIRVLVIGRKKRSYTLDKQLCERAKFSQADIWDITDLCKMALDMPLDRLQDLYDHIRCERARIAIELEVPDADGRFPTSISDYMESIPTPRMSDFKRYFQFHRDRHTEYDATLEEVETDFAELVARLRRLPRITREFYAVLLKRRDEESRRAVFSGSYWFSLDRFIRTCRYKDWEGELRLLESENLAWLDEAFVGEGKARFIRIFVHGKSDNFQYEFVEFLEHTDISFMKPLVALDFSDF